MSRHLEERLDELEGELVWARDLNEVGSQEIKSNLGDLRADLARLKSDLAMYQAQQDKLALRLETLSRGLSEIVGGLTKLETRMHAPRKIIRDEDGMITRVEVES